jgi:CheY-like chemotaxis protein
MDRDVNILIAEDDSGHAFLIKTNLNRAGISNNIIILKDGQEVMDFMNGKSRDECRESGKAYLLLLDIRMPKIDGIEVLRKMKGSEELKEIPVVMITTSDDPKEIKECHWIGCNGYIKKPVEYNKFVEAVRNLGFYLRIIEIPKVEA